MKTCVALLMLALLMAIAAYGDESLDDLKEAIKAGNREQVGALLKRHKSWAAAEFDDKHTTPLSMAIDQDDAALVQFLVKHGIKADEPLIKYRPPLFYAISKGNIKIVKILLDNGAKINGTDFTGVTPMKYAEHLEKDDIEELLRKYGGR
jgi:ankyrin repeat protein